MDIGNRRKSTFDGPLVSIILNNFNYERFVGKAIQSALGQSYSNIEVVVVDDGSSDNSKHVIDTYKEHVIPIFKKNGGQASAMNVGFEFCHGDVVLFLDSDDILHPDASFHIAEMLVRHPNVAKIQFKLQVIDNKNSRKKRIMPSSTYPAEIYDLRDQMKAIINYDGPPTSGNAFPVSTLKRILPIPEEIYSICADEYLNQASVLLGPIAASNRVVAYYRLHRSSYFSADENLDLSKVRREITRRQEGNRILSEFCQDDSGRSVSEPNEELPDLRMTVCRMTSVKLEPERHPITGDTIFKAWKDGLKLTAKHPGGLRKKILYVGWFTGFLIGPTILARWLAGQFHGFGMVRKTWS